MMGKYKLAIGVVALAAASIAHAQDGTIELSAFPSIGVADGRTPITITAVIRDRHGALVPNGTQVVFDSTLGTFRENVVTTENGYARATLLASSIPGVARIRASVLRYNAASNVEFEFVTDRAVLDSARDFIEVTAPKKLVYSVDDRIIEATGTGDGDEVVVSYRDIEIRASDLQLRVLTYEVKARNAKLKIGDKEYLFDQLIFKLNTRRGLGIGRFEVPVAIPHSAGLLTVPTFENKVRTGIVNVSSASGIEPVAEQPDMRQFAYQTIIDSISTVEAKKAVAYPRKEVQFHQSNVKVQGISVMKLPLFQVGTQTASPLITEQFINVSNNQLAINYPYYLSLKPGETSLLRFRYGNRFGAGLGAAGGAYVDYELKWNRGDEMEGGLTFNGINRNDWGVTLRQYYQADPTTTLTAQLDFPAHKSMFGNFNANKLFNGFQANLNASHGRSLAGGDTEFQTQQYSAIIEKDPIKIRSIGNLFLGLSANSNSISSGDYSNEQQGVGLQARFASRGFRLDRSTTGSFSYRLAQLSGRNVRNGVSHFATASLTSSISPNFTIMTTYDYMDDGFNSELLGRHRLTGEAFLTTGPVGFRGFVSKTLDLERLNASASFDYTFSQTWRFYYNFYLDRYLEDSFMDQTFVLGYRLGFREIGISYSMRTKRIGLELLGTRF